ncbi:RNA-binding protein 5-like isoform X2 [Eriocheir sinensis]|uniref:RNA-binding protein 5-like isoform X2 n=1 Tax=Eriocheir sinensis TaxID=95602 RepID=UPI0021C88085|nr:RNA-binding protein 5-like isoform X2 [Eriocheir sinensis]
MSNKYPVQVRMREMSKQEEVLLKRKREIERKMKEQYGGRKPAETGSPRQPPPSRSHEPSSSPGVEKEMVEPLANIRERTLGHGLCQIAGEMMSVPPEPGNVAPHIHHICPSFHHYKTSEAASSQVPNKFNNDGSFLEQFKKMSRSKSDIKEEKCSPPHKSKPSGQSTNKLKTYHHNLPKQIDPAHISSWQKSTSEEWKVSSSYDSRVDASAASEEVKPETDNPDWFKDALKRAQAKAKELSEVPSACSSEEDSSNNQFSDKAESKKRKSRWGGQPAPAAAPAAAPTTASTPAFSVPENLMDMVGEGEHFQAIHGVMVTRLTRNTPAIIAYAQKVFSSVDLTDAQWKQCEEQMKMNVVFQLLQAKKRESERLEQQGKLKYEYDSDEDTEGGTWEHKRRAIEMQETQARAVELTNMAEGKHHIGDFLPPDELARFMEKYRAIKEGRDPDLSDYQDHKLTEDNVGYRMLKSMGWTEGMGLGAEGKGITTPVNQNGRSESQGLGVERPENLQEEDDEYDAYRKRMMLAYRFRPNPLNNPRRAYY